jgi:hypothetical protein
MKAEETAVWGSQDSFKNAKSYIREMVITGADPSTIDKDTYTEKAIEEALKANEEFGGDNWGATSNNSEEEDLPW